MNNIKFKKVSDFDRGILFELLVDAYSYDSRYKKCCGSDWQEFDDFCFDNIEIADRCGFITTLDDTAIGLVSWDPRSLPDYVEIGYNCLATKYKGNGYGKLQLQEAVNRIIQNYNSKIIVTTNEELKPAQRMYESVGFKFHQRRSNKSEVSFSGEYIDYEYIL